MFYIKCIQNKSQQVCAILGASKKKPKESELAPWVLAKADKYFQSRNIALI